MKNSNTQDVSFMRHIIFINNSINMVLAPHPCPTAPVLTNFDLSGKTAVVTGDCRGISLEVARGLCEAGANVAITYSSTPQAEADNIAAIIAAANNSRTVVAYKCDVKSKTEVQATVEKATAELGAVKLDIVVANAGTISSVTYLMSTSMGHAGRRKQRPRFSKDSRKKKKLRIED
ncbi:hypothetical protein EIK77_001812 [Talaromyces pinophilus]|nr:hypothetical protein EIK77_001812 [Talaromyces pinophilus]